MRRRVRRLWADQRISADVWYDASEALGVISSGEKNMVNVNRETGLRLLPQSSNDWSNSEYFALRYDAPVGGQIAKVVFTWKFSEGAQQWAASLYDVTNISTLWSQATTDTTGTVQTVTLSPVSQAIEIRFTSNAAQTAPNDQSIFLYVYSLTVYATTTAITPSNLVKDLRAYLSELNSDETLISTNSLDIAPFIADKWEKVANELVAIARFGDSSFNPWAAYLRESEAAAAANGEPLLAFEKQPALTDHTYIVCQDELVSPIVVRKDYSKIENWLIVEYTDYNNRRRYMTPDDDANLKDDTSITNYGRREPAQPLRYANVSQAMAVNLARRHLAQWKDPQYLLSEPLALREYVRGKGGVIHPASLVRPGRNVLLEDYLDDLASNGVRLRLSKTVYDHDSRTVQLYSGPLDDLATTIAQLELPDKPGDYVLLK